jgi:ferredoxin
MPIPDALRPYADSLGLADSEALSVVFRILYDREDDLIIIPALPGTAKDISGKTGMPEDKVKEELYRLANKGSVIKMPGGHFILPHFALELRDFSMIWPEAPAEYFLAWQKIIDDEYAKALSKQRELGIKSRSRTLPIHEAVPSEGKVLDHISLRKIIKDASLVTTVPCPCRLQAETAGKRPSDCPAGDKAFCMQTGKMAQAVAKRGNATILTTEEALARIDDAARAGLVHNVTDVSDDYETASEIGMSICNCCPCCCVLLYSVRIGFPEILGKSGFQPVLNQEGCIGCGECVDRCPSSAISMNGVAQIDLEKCLGCGNCVAVCPEEALLMEKVIEGRA